jgi:hypothetical protein
MSKLPENTNSLMRLKRGLNEEDLTLNHLQKRHQQSLIDEQSI